jgi:hypothetical protein
MNERRKDIYKGKEKGRKEGNIQRKEGRKVKL